MIAEMNKAEQQYPTSPNIGRVINDFKYRQQLISNRIFFAEDC